MVADDSLRVEGLIRPELVALGGYSAHKPPDTLGGGISPQRVIKLDANENPYGCSPRVRQALADYSRWHIYPDAQQTKLRQQLQEQMAKFGIQVASPRGHPLPIYTHPPRLHTARTLLVGDAATLVDPFFGEGIRYAV